MVWDPSAVTKEGPRALWGHHGRAAEEGGREAQYFLINGSRPGISPRSDRVTMLCICPEDEAQERKEEEGERGGPRRQRLLRWPALRHHLQGFPAGKFPRNHLSDRRLAGYLPLVKTSAVTPNPSV